MAILDVRGFYDALAPWYHLVYQDWEASIARPGQALASLLASAPMTRPHGAEFDCRVSLRT